MATTKRERERERERNRFDRAAQGVLERGK